MPKKQFAKMNITVTASVFVGVLLMFIYFLAFSDCSYASCGRFNLPYNLPDHLIYTAVIQNINNVDWWLPFLANHGVAVFYYYLGDFLNSKDSEFLILSFTVNILLYIATINSYINLTNKLGLKNSKTILLVFYPPFLFFSALINKDMLLIFLVLRSCIALIDQSWRTLLLITIGLAFVRVQYMPLPLIALIIIRGRFWNRIVFLYVLTSICAALIARFSVVFEVDFEANGLSTFIYELNKNYLIGSLIFNPIRTVHYFLGFGNAWLLIFEDSGINLMKLIEGFTFFWFAWTLPGVFKFFSKIKNNEINKNHRIIGAIILGFIFSLLLTAITEVRYITPLFPLLLIASNIKNTLPKTMI